MVTKHTTKKNTTIPPRVSERFGLISSVQSEAELQSARTTDHPFSYTSYLTRVFDIRPATLYAKKVVEWQAADLSMIIVNLFYKNLSRAGTSCGFIILSFPDSSLCDI
jgi:hypothetical protein